LSREATQLPKVSVKTLTRLGSHLDKLVSAIGALHEIMIAIPQLCHAGDVV
jgi:hypothetical protein